MDAYNEMQYMYVMTRDNVNNDEAEEMSQRNKDTVARRGAKADQRQVINIQCVVCVRID